jgi:hypothetical protein
MLVLSIVACNLILGGVVCFVLKSPMVLGGLSFTVGTFSLHGISCTGSALINIYCCSSKKIKAI